MLCTAPGVAFRQQIDGFVWICRDWAEVWIGLDGSAMGGRTMASSSTDHELSRAITSRSSAYKSSDWRVLAEFWLGPAVVPTCTLSSVLRRKLTCDRMHLPRRAPLCREMTGALDRRADK